MSVAAALMFIGLLLGVVTACFALYAAAGNERIYPIVRYSGWTAIVFILLGAFMNLGW